MSFGQLDITSSHDGIPFKDMDFVFGEGVQDWLDLWRGSNQSGSQEGGEEGREAHLGGCPRVELKRAVGVMRPESSVS